MYLYFYNHVMVKYFSSIFVTLIVIFFTGCFFPKKNTAQNSEKNRLDMMQADQHFSDLSEAKGMKAAFLEYIDSNGVLLRPDHIPVAGADAIDYLIATNDTGYQLTWHPKTAVIAASGDLGYTYGLYEIKPAVKDTVLYGTYVSIWKKQLDGKWKFVWIRAMKVSAIRKINNSSFMIKKIALVTGGYSGESVISYRSAETIKNNIDPGKWECYVIDIRPDGWWYKNASGEETGVDKNDFSITSDGKKINFDAVLIGLHGTPGEDGKLQGYFDCIGIPYTSCDAATSALTFNKRYTVAVAAFAGINVARSVHLFKNGNTTADEILKQLSLPVFLKPNNGGSSIGMSKVNAAGDLEAACKKLLTKMSRCSQKNLLKEENSPSVFSDQKEK